MADDVHIYGLDAAKNQIATMSTEQILAAIQRAIETGEVTDEFKAFIEMIKEQNKGIGVKFWLGSQDEFNALEKTESNTIYFVYTTVIKDISDGIQKLYDGLRDGTIVVKTATDANNVALKINGKNISDIFEGDGVTAKKATNAANAANAANADKATNAANADKVKANDNTYKSYKDASKTLLWSGDWGGDYDDRITVPNISKYAQILVKPYVSIGSEVARNKLYSFVETFGGRILMSFSCGCTYEADECGRGFASAAVHTHGTNESSETHTKAIEYFLVLSSTEKDVVTHFLQNDDKLGSWRTFPAAITEIWGLEASRID